MSKARLVIIAVVVEGRDPAEVAKTYGVSKSWLYELLARHRAEGDANATTGELLRELTIDPSRHYQSRE